MDWDNLNLFMACPQVREDAFVPLPEGYTCRFCRKDELDVWKEILSDGDDAGKRYLDSYFQQHYAPGGDLFFQKCRLVCNKQGIPVATGFLWKYEKGYETVHWLKTRPEFEGRGIGRGLLTILLRDVKSPVYLHTQPTSVRAIKLYTDFGFYLIDDPMVDGRENHLEVARGYLKTNMSREAYERLAYIHVDGKPL